MPKKKTPAKGEGAREAPRYVAGLHLVTPPLSGRIHPVLGVFKDGDEPRKCHLSAELAAELDGPSSPFTIEKLPEE